jgi:phage gpG-like protein
MAVKFIDNTAIVLRKIDANCSRAMQAVADVLVEGVQSKMLYGYHTPHGNPPHTEIVDTGALFDSIEASPGKASQNTYGVNVGTNMHYASYVHDGTSKLAGRPFIKDGVMEASDQVREVLSEIIPNGFIS